MEGICATLNSHIQALVGDTKQDIHLKDVILTLSWGEPKLNACKKNTSYTVVALFPICIVFCIQRKSDTR